MRTALYALLLATACATAQPRTTDTAAPASAVGTVFFTHPSVHVLKNLQTLSDEGLLPTDRFHFVGVHHARELEDYSEAEQFAQHGERTWLSLRTLDCDVDATNLFATNGCTPVFEQLLKQSVGTIFLGGPDIPPTLYGEPTSHTTVIRAPQRHYYELSWLYHLVGRGGEAEAQPLLRTRPDYPVFAICLGMQSLNVAAGGTLVQDIPTELYEAFSMEAAGALPAEQQHRNTAPALVPAEGIAYGVFHPVSVRPDSALAALLAEGGGKPLVLSIHHQAVQKLGGGLRIAATSTDSKVVEALEHEEFTGVLGVQFHPEYRFLWQPQGDYALQAGATPRNHAFATMAESEPSRRFVRGIWALLESRLIAQAGDHSGAQ